MFRGFTATRVAGGRVRYAFQWVFRRPVQAVFNPRTRTLGFPSLFPHVRRVSGLAATLDAVATARTERGQPAHKRLDGRRARLVASTRDGAWSLAVNIRGAHHAYAIAKTLDAIHECVVTLQEGYPDYLIREFGASPE